MENELWQRATRLPTRDLHAKAIIIDPDLCCGCNSVSLCVG